MTSGLFSMAVASGRTAGQDEGVAMGVENLSAWLESHVAAILAVIAAATAIVAAWVGRKESQRQQALQQQTLRNNLDAQSLNWGNACLDTLNRAAVFARTRQHQANDAGFLQQRVNMMLALSSLIDRGRILFPDVDPVSKDSSSTAARQSVRPPILDVLKLARHEVEALTRQGGPTAANSAEYIDDCREFLIAELQAHIDARRQAARSDRYDARPLAQSTAAFEQVRVLQTLLKSRRPGIDISDRKETVQ
ncbi:MAG: hypothetical protein AAF996_07040 [Pseudomonadota bacterium]